MSAFRPRGFRFPSRSKERHALRAERVADGAPVDYRAEKGRGVPADFQPTRRRGRKNPRWAGILAGLRHHGEPYAVVPAPTPRKAKKARTAPKILPKRERLSA